jgi:DNA-binding CsgD family transcriptional regulator
MLFVERSAAASGTFELNASNQEAVVNLCRRLDGLPLAIELAAVRSRVLTVEQILGRLSDRFALLTGGSRAALPRHQTLRTTIEWSHDLLADDERTLFRRLCVFAGRFTLEDVESVCASENMPKSRVLDLVSSLVDKSLVMKEDSKSIACYRQHETTCDFASHKMREAGEEEVVWRQYADHYGSKCRQSALEGRHRLLEWLEWMDLEIDNVRSLLQRSLIRADIQQGVELVSSLGWYWMTRATTEGVRWLDELLASGEGNPQVYASAYFVRGFLAVLQSDPTSARPALHQAAAAARETGQLRLLSEALSMASIAEAMAGDRASARRLLDDAQANTAGLDDPLAQIAVLQARAMNGLFDGDLDAVTSSASQGARIGRETGDLYTLEMMLLNLGSAAMMIGSLDESGPLLAESLQIAQLIDDRVAQSYLLAALGFHAARSGQPRQAAQLLGASETARLGAGANVMPFIAPLLAQAEESALAALGEAKFEADVETGKRLDRDAVFGLALGRSPRVEATTSESAAVGSLGKREADVALLVADGLTNKQIAARLFISERTVDSHVRSILNKLGFNSRAQIAAWIGRSTQ